MAKKEKENTIKDPTHIETDIDKLLKMILKNEKVMLSEAVSTFGVSKEVIEEWGNILESNSLIEVHYPIIGEPSLQVIREKKEKLKKSEKKKDVKIRLPEKAPKELEKQESIKPKKKKFNKKIGAITTAIIAISLVLLALYFTGYGTSLFESISYFMNIYLPQLGEYSMLAKTYLLLIVIVPIIIIITGFLTLKKYNVNIKSFRLGRK
ncbi:MAG: hypothetical protein ABIF08_02210 [Nanoarchaeota archaeon]